MPRIGIGIGIPRIRITGEGAAPSFPNNISDPIEKAIVEALGITEAEYNANGIANSVSAWIAADGDVTLDINDHVSLVADKSGNGNNAVPFNEEIEIVAGGLGGKNAFKLVSGATEEGGLLIDNAGFSVNGPSTLILLFQSGNDDAYITFSGETTSRYAIVVQDGSLSLTISNEVSGLNFFLNSIEYANTPNRNAIHDTLILNPYTIFTLQGDFNNWSSLNIMGYNASDTLFNFDAEWYESLVIPGTLTTQQREAIEAAIANKYGITLP